MTRMWGIHNDTLGSQPFDEGFISVGWEGIGDVRQFGGDREQIKTAVTRTFPHAKPGAIPVWAGMLHRFAVTMQPGDLVVATYKSDSTLNIGRIEGEYEFLPDQAQHPHRRRVRWLQTGIPRNVFDQAALYEVGSALTLFQIRKHDSDFRAYLENPTTDGNIAPQQERPRGSDQDEDQMVQDVSDDPNADRIEQHTQDFIAKTLLRDLSHEEFEHFIADLLRAMGYQARVTPYSNDGGVDVLAHKDILGVEPPLIKVQCKHTVAPQSRPDLQRLIGTLSHGEVGLFITLGTYSKDGIALERERQNLRLFDGAEVTRLTLQHYNALPSRWRSLMPLRSVLVVDLPLESQ